VQCIVSQVLARGGEGSKYFRKLIEVTPTILTGSPKVVFLYLHLLQLVCPFDSCHNCGKDLTPEVINFRCSKA